MTEIEITLSQGRVVTEILGLAGIGAGDASTPAMKRTCIAVVDAARARLFSYEPHGELEPASPAELSQDGRREQGKFSDTKPGNRWQEGGRGSTDDHRNDQIAVHDEKFLRRVLDEVARQVQEHGCTDVVLISGPKMLGIARSIDHPLANSVTITELAQDLAWMTPSQLHDHLAEKQVIGPRPRMQLRSNPPGA